MSQIRTEPGVSSSLLRYWELSRSPFENTPDPTFLYPSREHTEALLRLRYAVEAEKGCAMLTGEYGCGKTILVRTLIHRLGSESFEIALIQYPFFSRATFLSEVLQQFGQTAEGGERSQWFQQISAFVYRNFGRKRKSLLILDEAHMIDDPRVLEEIRLLLNIQLEDCFLIDIILVGQPELREKILLHPQLEQRIAIRYHLHRFSREDTLRYVRHRLDVAGRRKLLFTEPALHLIFQQSNGVPRRINNIADLCLFEGFRRRNPQVDEKIVRSVI